MAASAPIDLGLPAECSYTEEHWRPSHDYPEVTVHALRQEGDELVITTTPAYGQRYERRWRIDAVHRSLGRAELAPLHPQEGPRHLDLFTHRLVGTQEPLRVPLEVARDPRDPSVLLGLLAVLTDVGPQLYPSLAGRSFTREEVTGLAWSTRGDRREARARWAAPSGIAPTTTAPWIAEMFGRKPADVEPGYGVALDVGPDLERFEVYLAEAATALLSVALWAGGTPRGLIQAAVPRHVSLRALDVAFRRLSEALVDAREADRSSG